MEGDLELFICGVRGSRPLSKPDFAEFGGATVCNIVRRKDCAVVVDCGSGLYGAKKILESCRKIDVLLTHMHYDHLLGLLDYTVFPEEAQVRFISNFDCWYGQETLSRFMQPPFWPYTPSFGPLCSVTPPQQMELCGGITADFRLSDHPDDAMLIRLEAGGRRLSFVCDFEHGRIELDDWARGSDWLIYDGTYTPQEYPSHADWGHSTWELGCKLARSCGAARLLITHHATTHTDVVLREQEMLARAVFPETYFARQGQKFVIEQEKNDGV